MRALPILALGLLSLVSGCGEGRLAATFDRSFDVGEARRFELDNGSGDLEIIGEQGRQTVEIHAELRTFRVDENRDDDAARRVVIDYRPLDDTAAQIVAGLDHPPSGYHLDVTVLVPAEAFMVVDDDSADVLIEGIGALELHDDSGDAVIRDVAGDVGIDDGSGDLSIGRVGGDVFVNDDSGDLHIDSVAGDVDVEDDSGDIAISHVAGLVTLRDGSGDIAVIDAGDVVIDADGSGDVSVR